ncbi:DUF4230 domain-containing protein [Haloferula sp. A504]|uniref:DUF4230 domain-containing protein n=1 Tax=Haloferula sp. A504 TaxID=3373601 RepID=UPI0031C95257|nr:DUF4230 domain-containing protein [Verrucomicrobiaceae bacterium E54]
MSHHPELWKTVRWLSLLAAVVILVLFGFRAFERSVGGAASGMGEGLDKVLGALTHSDTTIIEGRAEVVQRNEIHELSLLELRMSATRSFENEAFVLKYLSAGTKRLIIRGDYRVTAGYRLKPGVSLQIEDGIPVARFPEPEILGVELIDFEVLSEKDGWWNEVTAEDRATLLRELRQQMRMEAAKSGALDLVDSTLRDRVQSLMGSANVRVERPEEEGSER